MFGFVQANLADLSQEEIERYQSAYCGLCKTIGKRHGQIARLGLSYDLTFLSLLLSSLYEAEEQCKDCKCIIHPCKRKSCISSFYTDYAADMSVALTYYKCLDDWKDDRNLIRYCYAKLLEKSFRRVKADWPRQCEGIEKELNVLSRIEEEKNFGPDAAANSFGRLMADLFVIRQDNWEQSLRALGYGLGRYIYFADAALDYEKDKARDSYNPLNYIEIKPEEMKYILTNVLGEASKAFEFLPLLQDEHLLKNIMYSGIWLKFNQGMEKRGKIKNG